MRLIVPLLLVLTLFTGCAARPETPPPQRFGWVIMLKPDQVDRYKTLHAQVWPGVQRMITACNIHNYTIYLRETEPGKWYLFSYLEYTGADFTADMKRMAADAETQRWWAETAPCQQPIPLAKPGETWATMEEVYRQE